MSKRSLDSFGKILINNVRDEAIDDWERILTGKMNDEDSKQIYSTLSDSEKALLGRFLPKIVDTTLHHLLRTFEQEEILELTIKTGIEKEKINEISDGLAGELYSEEGWIYRFSNKEKQ